MSFSALSHHLQQVFACELVAHVRAFENVLRKSQLAFVQPLYLLLYRSLGNEVVNGHRLLLPYTVNTVCCLRLYSGVPLRVSMYDVVSACKVQSQTARLEGYKEHGAAAILKFLHQFLACFEVY